MSAFMAYLGWYVLEHGYALHPSPSYIAYCYGTGMFRAVAEERAGRLPF